MIETIISKTKVVKKLANYKSIQKRKKERKKRKKNEIGQHTFTNYNDTNH